MTYQIEALSFKIVSDQSGPGIFLKSKPNASMTAYC